MCIILLAYRAHSEYPLVVAANRDEFYERRTAAARFWTDSKSVLAGRDLERGGTWLGVTKGGRIAAVTNYREPDAKVENAPSRGQLVSDFLTNGEPPHLYLSKLHERAQDYNGFNLIVGTSRELYYYSNRAEAVQELEPGVHGLSNHLLNTPWPKVSRGLQSLADAIAHDRALFVETVFQILADDARAVDERLPQTGVGLELERVLSPLFITTPVYGTRSSTVVLFNRKNEVQFFERTFHPASALYEEVRYEFKIEE